MAHSRLVACLLTEPDGRYDRLVAGPGALLGRHVDVWDRPGAAGTTVCEPGGATIPGTAAATRWTSLAIMGSAGIRRRVLVAHKGRLRFDAQDLIDALGAELTLASDRVELSQNLHRQEVEARFRSLIQNASDVILVAQANGSLRAETPSLHAVLGHSVEAVESLRLEGLVHPLDAPRAVAQIDALLAGVRTGPLSTEWRVLHADGRWLAMEVIANDLSRDPNVAGVVLTLRDVSGCKVLEEELRHQAFHDSLTGLANRVRFDAIVGDALARMRRARTTVSVLFVDVDDFKFVNDTLGHPAGDELLVEGTRADPRVPSSRGHRGPPRW